jgi:hypothetical protein
MLNGVFAKTEFIFEPGKKEKQIINGLNALPVIHTISRIQYIVLDS